MKRSEIKKDGKGYVTEKGQDEYYTELTKWENELIDLLHRTCPSTGKVHEKVDNDPDYKRLPTAGHSIWNWLRSRGFVLDQQQPYRIGKPGSRWHYHQGLRFTKKNYQSTSYFAELTIGDTGSHGEWGIRLSLPLYRENQSAGRRPRYPGWYHKTTQYTAKFITDGQHLHSGGSFDTNYIPTKIETNWSTLQRTINRSVDADVEQKLVQDRQAKASKERYDERKTKEVEENRKYESRMNEAECELISVFGTGNVRTGSGKNHLIVIEHKPFGETEERSVAVHIKNDGSYTFTVTLMGLSGVNVSQAFRSVGERPGQRGGVE
jgi:hypothetical protein